MAEIRLQDGESIESALRRFKRKVQTEEIIKEVNRHSYYLKPGAKRRVKQALARQRAEKDTQRAGLSCRHFVRCCRFRSKGLGSLRDNDASGWKQKPPQVTFAL